MGEGHKRHWILDDNIGKFSRFNRNRKVKVMNGAPFIVVEDFTDRYENIALSGLNYRTFVIERQKKIVSPIRFNTRIYSCILINNDLEYRWRGRYNEDTDLALRALKAGWCTALFNAFCCDKMQTMTTVGGNTEGLYHGDGRLLMAQSLQKQHSDVVKIKRKWGRWQHSVDYRPFKANKLLRRSDIDIPNKTNNYGLKLVKVAVRPARSNSARKK